MSSLKGNIVILTSDGQHHKYLISNLCNCFNIRAVVIESAKDQASAYLHKKKYKDYFYLQYHSLRRKVMGLDKYRKKYFQTELNKDVNIIKASSINSLIVEDLLLKIKPEITIVMGTSIIKSKILNLCGDKIINIHGGYLPDYRGNHCFFFALLNRDYDKIGSTIHFKKFMSLVNTGL